MLHAELSCPISVSRKSYRLDKAGAHDENGEGRGGRGVLCHMNYPRYPLGTNIFTALSSILLGEQAVPSHQNRLKCMHWDVPCVYWPFCWPCPSPASPAREFDVVEPKYPSPWLPPERQSRYRPGRSPGRVRIDTKGRHGRRTTRRSGSHNTSRKSPPDSARNREAFSANGGGVRGTGACPDAVPCSRRPPAFAYSRKCSKEVDLYIFPVYSHSSGAAPTACIPLHVLKDHYS